MTDAMIKALRTLKGYRRWVSASGCGVRPGVMSALARARCVDVLKNSERVRGERRAYWSEYRINERGRSALDQL